MVAARLSLPILLFCRIKKYSPRHREDSLVKIPIDAVICSAAQTFTHPLTAVPASFSRAPRRKTRSCIRLRLARPLTQNQAAHPPFSRRSPPRSRVALHLALPTNSDGARRLIAYRTTVDIITSGVSGCDEAATQPLGPSTITFESSTAPSSIFDSTRTIQQHVLPFQISQR